MCVLYAVLSILCFCSAVTSTQEYYALQGKSTLIFEDHENGQVVERRMEIPSGSSNDDWQQGIQGPLHNSASMYFMDRHEFTYEGTHYLAILANSSVLILRVESTRTVYDSEIPLPSGCRPKYIQPKYSVDPGIIYVTFESCAPYYIDALFDVHYPAVEEHDGRKMIALADSSGEYLVYINDQRRLHIEEATEGTQRVQIPPSDIGSCSVLRDLHPFRPSSGSDLPIIVDCDSQTGMQLRYVLFYDFSSRSIARTFQVRVAAGEPLANGRFLAVLHNDKRTLSIFDVDGESSQTPATRNFGIAVEQVKFITTDAFTILVVYQLGENITLIDVPQRHGSEVLYQQPGTVVQSCSPVCPAVEVMGEAFVMMTTYNPETHFFDIVYRPLDTTSPTAPVRLRGPASQPLLAFVQTSLEVAPSTTASTTSSISTEEPVPATTTELGTTSELGTTEALTKPATTVPITEPVVLYIALSIIVTAGGVALGIVVACAWWLCRRNSRCRKSHMARRTEDPEDPPAYTPSVSNPSGSLPIPPSPVLSMKIESDDSSLSQMDSQSADSQSTHSEEIVQPTDAQNESRAEAVIPPNTLPMIRLPSSQTELPRATQHTPIMQETHNLDSGFQSRSSLSASDSPQPRSKLVRLNITTCMFHRSRTAEPVAPS